ncbi:chromate transporter [Candidatus Sumerlaeota bacterium]|nr:chromate transporter [Candidatus Sumerlaeales bacterium]NLD60910.1 chromate transporter [Candidatus Sumerlaeota bacterium]
MLIGKLLTLFYMFFKLGLFSFGGGYVILPLMYQEIQAFGVMSPQEFSDLVALSQITPGPIALNGATYVGYQYAGILGAIVSTFAVSLPSFIIVLIVFAFLVRFKNSAPVQLFLGGVRPATVGLIAAAVLFFGQNSVFTTPSLVELVQHPIANTNGIGLIIAIVAGIALAKYKISPIAISLAGGALGMLFMRG